MEPKFKYPEPRDLRFERTDPNPATPFSSEVARVDMITNVIVILLVLAAAAVVTL